MLFEDVKKDFGFLKPDRYDTLKKSDDIFEDVYGQVYASLFVKFSFFFFMFLSFGKMVSISFGIL